MKLYRISFALLLGLGVMTSCDDKLDLINPTSRRLKLGVTLQLTSKKP